MLLMKLSQQTIVTAPFKNLRQIYERLGGIGT